MDRPISPIVTAEVRIVDMDGRPRLLLSANGDGPTVQLLRSDGTPGLTLSLPADGNPTISLAGPRPGGPVAALEIDAMGAHIKFDHPSRASAYLFLNNAGTSGVVLTDTNGRRRLDATVATDGTPQIRRLGADGQEEGG